MNHLVPKTGGEGTNLACFSKHLQKSGKWSEQANDLKKKELPWLSELRRGLSRVPVVEPSAVRQQKARHKVWKIQEMAGVL